MQFNFTHKICPICKENKKVEEYNYYFSKKRNKYRVGNYCKPCAKIDAKPRAIKNYLDNREARLQYCKEYRNNPANQEKLKTLKNKFKKKYVEILQDCYVRELLVSRNKITNEFINENPEIIETKRLQIKIKRKLKNLKDGKE